MPVSKPGQIRCSSKEQSHIVLPSQEYQVNQCVVYEEQNKTSKQECQAHVIYVCDDKNQVYSYVASKVSNEIYPYVVS